VHLADQALVDVDPLAHLVALELVGVDPFVGLADLVALEVALELVVEQAFVLVVA
jgi:hypothetical protein